MVKKAYWSSTPLNDKTEAEKAAGPSELGYLYRLCWSRSSRMAELKAFRIIKKTPRGWRIALNRYSSDTKLILEGTARKFASETIALAAEAYIARRTWWRDCLRYKLEEAEEAIRAVKMPDVKKEFDYFLGDEPFPLIPPSKLVGWGDPFDLELDLEAA